MAVHLTSSGLSMPASISASGDANTLDDYEEGAWTPNIIGSGGSAGTHANVGREGDYVKVGTMIYFTFYAYVSNVGSYSGNLRVTGMPFTNTGFGNVTTIVVGAHSMNNAAMIAAGISGAASYISFMKGAYQQTLVPWSDVGIGRSFSLTGTYHLSG